MCTKELQRLLNDNFPKLRDGVRAQLLWLTRELIALDAHDAEGLCLNLLRQVRLHPSPTQLHPLGAGGCHELTTPFRHAPRAIVPRSRHCPRRTPTTLHCL